MNVYILVHEPYHDNSTIKGVYDSLEKAKDVIAGKWDDPDDEGWYKANIKNAVAEVFIPNPVTNDGDWFVIYRWEIR